MRDVLIATLGAALTLGSAADAQQRVVDHGPVDLRPGAPFSAPADGSSTADDQAAPRAQGNGQREWRPASWQNVRRSGEPGAQPASPRWGSKVDGRWWGGANAPGGWDAYRRPYRGYALPAYWTAPRFSVADWQRYGLWQPGDGRHWVRYYDDAVLVDTRGSVYDIRSDVDWDGADRSDPVVDMHHGNAEQVADRPGNAAGGHEPRYYDDGGDAGQRVARRGDRPAETAMSAGAGYAPDQGVDHRPPPQVPGYHRHGSDIPVAPERVPPPPPPPPLPPVAYGHGGGEWRSADGTTTVTTVSEAGGYYRDGFFYPGPSTTTVVVQTAPVVTTTTTEYFEDAVTYTRVRKPVVHARVKLRRAWRPAPKCQCR